MANPERERDLVLAPNEFAYISDQTKGHIVAYVGPYKTSMANTDQPVYFEEKDKRFKVCSLEQSIKTFTVVPEGWYVMLKNPAKDNKQPTPGTANTLTSLDIGRKVNIPGPLFFSLWPGQMGKVIKGHSLRSNQYLLVRVYEEEQARKNWGTAVIKPQDNLTEIEQQLPTGDEEVKSEKEIPDLSLGKLLVIKGANVSFYIPPTGIEVIPDERENYIRDAVTLERLEYCILLNENGNKHYIKGPAVVFPKPTERFYLKGGLRKFKAIELSETSGIYVKVIAPYTEGGKTYNMGDELFITGKDQMIYFPRQEHALIKYGAHEIYQAVAIPAGEGRYFLNRKTGQISLQKGPCMFLPDPREAVIVQRILTQKQASLWYPGNNDVLKYNSVLSSLASKQKFDDFIPAEQVQQVADEVAESTKREKVSTELASEEFNRSQTYTSARTITLDTKFAGAVTVNVWTGYALLVVGKSGTRKVIVGPFSNLLEYDEDLGVMELSTGTPKSDDKTIRTVYLRVLYNKVSDVVNVETKDLVPLSISLSYRINFTGEPEKWFNVENYVKFLTDHMRSVIRNAIKKYSITEFYANGIDIIRNVVLGTTDDKGHRKSRTFEENGMQIYDVEIFNIQIEDETVEELLVHAQHEEVKQKLEVETKKQSLVYTTHIEDFSRKIAEEKSQSKLQSIDLLLKEAQKELLFSLSKLEAGIQTQQRTLESKLSEQDMLGKINDSKLLQEKANKDLQIEFAQKTLNQEIERIQAEVVSVVRKAEAVSPDLIAALQAFSDRALAERMAQSMSPLSILGGKSVAEIFANMLKGTVLENVLNPVEKKELPLPKPEEKIEKPKK